MKKGFTLIELLVVIAIIGILSGVVLTGLSSARTKAKDSRVISNLKQAKTVVELNRQNGNALKLSELYSVSDFSNLRLDVCTQQGVICPPNSGKNLGTSLPYAGIMKTPSKTATSDYCLYAWLPSSKSSGWNKAVCMDSKGKTNLNYLSSDPLNIFPCDSHHDCQK
jgi:prepilin-type N-terminal cleavage/methylation domain-containing protein